MITITLCTHKSELASTKSLLESFRSKGAFKRDFQKKSCPCVMKTLQFFFFWNKLLRLEHVLFLKVSFTSYFRKKTFWCVTTLRRLVQVLCRLYSLSRSLELFLARRNLYRAQPMLLPLLVGHRIHYIVTGNCAKYCSQRVCMSVSPVLYLKNHRSKLHKIFCTCYFLWLQFNTLCSSSFMDGIMLSHNWVYVVYGEAYLWGMSVSGRLRLWLCPSLTTMHYVYIYFRFCGLHHIMGQVWMQAVSLQRRQLFVTRQVALLNCILDGEICYCWLPYYFILVMSMSVCLPVCADIFGTTLAIFTKFFVHVAYVHGSVLLQHVDDRPHRLLAGRNDGSTQCEV